MPATPAWPPKSLPRLYVREPLAEGAVVALDPAQANYLGNVMRKAVGDRLHLGLRRQAKWRREGKTRWQPNSD